ncbi:hypothetical protein WA158_005081 [Blastocystis sp. Blastoise]
MHFTSVLFVCALIVASVAQNCGTVSDSCSNTILNKDHYFQNFATVYGEKQGTPKALTVTTNHNLVSDCGSGSRVYSTETTYQLTNPVAGNNGYTTYTLSSCSGYLSIKKSDAQSLNTVNFLYSCDGSGSYDKVQCSLLNQPLNMKDIYCSGEGTTVNLKFDEQKIYANGAVNFSLSRSSTSGCQLPGWAIALIVIGCVIVVAIIVFVIYLFTCKNKKSKLSRKH